MQTRILRSMNFYHMSHPIYKGIVQYQKVLEYTKMLFDRPKNDKEFENIMKKFKKSN